MAFTSYVTNNSAGTPRMRSGRDWPDKARKQLGIRWPWENNITLNYERLCPYIRCLWSCRLEEGKDLQYNGKGLELLVCSRRFGTVGILGVLTFCQAGRRVAVLRRKLMKETICSNLTLRYDRPCHYILCIGRNGIILMWYSADDTMGTTGFYIPQQCAILIGYCSWGCWLLLTQSSAIIYTLY